MANGSAQEVEVQVDLLSLQEDLHQFVHDLLMPSLSLDNRDSMDTEITGDELRAGLGQLPLEYWYLVWTQAGPLLLEMFQEALKSDELLPDLRTANTVVLPMPGTAHIVKTFNPFCS
ncbi:hypothetical protein NDU88_012251 [Pleurodeles waltl]|uniref:Uncharacterized protein n=1 Tax=Pleurodeles waltl TaxID=8319 RepID=A0AAV7R5E6_PLEWA|nr:hypothetical protein NDU88_012251 [Pleurodeles waltl]